MSADSSGLVEGSSAGAGVHSNGLADDKTIADELADSLSGVGVRDFVDFVGVQPDLALAAADDGRRQALLSTEIDPIFLCIISIEAVVKVVDVMTPRRSSLGVSTTIDLVRRPSVVRITLQYLHLAESRKRLMVGLSMSERWMSGLSQVQVRVSRDFRRCVPSKSRACCLLHCKLLPRVRIASHQESRKIPALKPDAFSLTGEST
jgi:hypothetical protein